VKKNYREQQAGRHKTMILSADFTSFDGRAGWQFVCSVLRSLDLKKNAWNQKKVGNHVVRRLLVGG